MGAFCVYFILDEEIKQLVEIGMMNGFGLKKPNETVYFKLP